MNSTNLCASILISNSHCIVSRQERSFFLPWFIYLLYFPSYFLLALEWSCFINKFSFSSIFSLFLFVGSFLSAYKHVQVLLIKKKKLFFFPFVCSPLYTLPVKLLERTAQSHWHHFLTTQSPSHWSLVNASIISLKLLIKTHQSPPSWWI